MKKLKDKKGSATTIIIIVLLIALGLLGLYIKMNWRVFKAEASFGFTLGVLVVLAVVLIYVLIRHSLKKAKKEREQAKLEKEQAKLEQEQAKLEEKKAQLEDKSGAGKEE